MNFIQLQSTLFYQNLNPLMLAANQREVFDKKELLKDILFMIHCSRLMLCVFIDFFLAGITHLGYEEQWTTTAALGFTIFLHIFFELLSVRQHFGKHFSSYFFYL